MRTCGEGKYRVWLDQYKIGRDLVFVLGGGEQSHIGGVVICKPGEEPQIISFEGHYDTVVLAPIAEAACTKYNTTVVAIGGIHIDNATKKDIETVIKNCHDLTKHF